MTAVTVSVAGGWPPPSNPLRPDGRAVISEPPSHCDVEGEIRTLRVQNRELRRQVADLAQELELLRLASGASADMIHLAGGVTVDRLGVLRIAERILPLSPTEGRILLVLARCAPATASYADCVSSVWGHVRDTGVCDIADRHCLSVTAHRLRTKLRALQCGLRIETVFGVGYCLVSEAGGEIV